MFSTPLLRRSGMLAASIALAALLAACRTPGAATMSAPAPQPPMSAAATQPTAQAMTSAAATQPPMSAAAPSAPAPQAPAQPTTAASSDVLSATQTLLDYYGAIDRHDYARAYALWGANASGQTLAQFTQGFAATRQVAVVLGAPGQPDAAAGSVYVELPITVIAATDADVQQFSGIYTLRRSNNVPGGDPRWKIARAQIAPLSAAPPAPPAEVVQSYYDAINHRRYPQAYALWGQVGADSQQTLAQFAQGFAATDQVAIQLGNVAENAGAGSAFADIPVLITATQTDKRVQSYCGTYTLRRVNAVGGGKLPWRIARAQVAPLRGDTQLSGDAVQRLLDNGCKP